MEDKTGTENFINKIHCIDWIKGLEQLDNDSIESYQNLWKENEK